MKHVLLPLVALGMVFAATAAAVDLSTPESAVASYYGAYERQNVDDIITARDFEFEPREVLSRTGSQALDEELVRRTAKDMEAAFRDQAQKRGLPRVDRGRCEIVTIRTLRDDLVQLFEQCSHQRGSTFTSLRVAKSEAGWRVVLRP
jgi:hypothetical protein